MATPVATIESFLGESLTPATSRRLAQAPADQLEELRGQLDDARREWFSAASVEPERYYVVDVVPQGGNVDEALRRLKGLLLYFPRFAIPDPLAFFDHRISFAVDSPSVRTHLLRLLTFLAELAPLITAGDVLLVPSVAYKAAPFAAEIEAERALLREHITAPPPEGWARMQVALHGHLCAAYEYTPLASSRAVADILDSEFRSAKLKRAPEDIGRVASAALTYKIPGTQKASIEQIIELRKSEAAFAELRSVLGEMVSRAHQVSGDETTFHRRLKEQMDGTLRPIVRGLNDTLKRPSVLNDVLIGGATSLGCTWMAYELFQGDPRSSLLGAAALPVSWAVKYLLALRGKAKQDAKRLLAFYGRMIEE